MRFVPEEDRNIKNKLSGKMKKNKKIIVIVILTVLLVLAVVGMLIVKSNPRVRILSSIIKFSESTLNNKEYLLYDVDIMELFSDYANSDTRITGVMGLPEIKGLDASISIDMEATRSFDQKKFASESSLNLLWIEAGELNMYAQDNTWYLTAPLLGSDIGYAFPTDLDWFPKMPELTSDIDREWFRDNYSNIVELITEIEVEEIDNDGFLVTIHKGDGHFIWELLGMEDPDYDVKISMYLTKDNNLSRMELDLSDVLEGAFLVLDGENASKCIFTYELPENESMEMVLERNPDATNWMDMTITYFGNNDKNYIMTGGLNWEEIKNGFKMNVKGFKLECDDELLARGYFLGKVVKEEASSDVFDGQSDYLNSLEVIQWKTVRDDTEGFIDDVLDEISLPGLRK